MAIEVTEVDRLFASQLFYAGDFPKAAEMAARHRTESIAAYLDALIASLPDGAVEAGMEAMMAEMQPYELCPIHSVDLQRAITAVLQNVRNADAR
jgi:hypothetical protein